MFVYNFTTAGMYYGLRWYILGHCGRRKPENSGRARRVGSWPWAPRTVSMGGSWPTAGADGVIGQRRRRHRPLPGGELVVSPDDAGSSGESWPTTCRDGDVERRRRQRRTLPGGELAVGPDGKSRRAGAGPPRAETGVETSTRRTGGGRTACLLPISTRSSRTRYVGFRAGPTGPRAAPQTTRRRSAGASGDSGARHTIGIGAGEPHSRES